MQKTKFCELHSSFHRVINSIDVNGVILVPPGFQAENVVPKDIVQSCKPGKGAPAVEQRERGQTAKKSHLHSTHTLRRRVCSRSANNQQPERRALRSAAWCRRHKDCLSKWLICSHTFFMFCCSAKRSPLFPFINPSTI